MSNWMDLEGNGSGLAEVSQRHFRVCADESEADPRSQQTARR
jgi:hypothetical protein